MRELWIPYQDAPETTARRAWNPAFSQLFRIHPWDVKKLTVEELDQFRTYDPVPAL